MPTWSLRESSPSIARKNTDIPSSVPKHLKSPPKLGGEPSEARRVDSKRERSVCLHARNGIVRYEQFLERSPVTGSGTRARRSPYSRVPLVLADPSVCRGARRFLTARAPEKL